MTALRDMFRRAYRVIGWTRNEAYGSHNVKKYEIVGMKPIGLETARVGLTQDGREIVLATNPAPREEV